MTQGLTNCVVIMGICYTKVSVPTNVFLYCPCTFGKPKEYCLSYQELCYKGIYTVQRINNNNNNNNHLYSALSIRLRALIQVEHLTVSVFAFVVTVDWLHCKAKWQMLLGRNDNILSGKKHIVTFSQIELCHSHLATSVILYRAVINQPRQ